MIRFERDNPALFEELVHSGASSGDDLTIVTKRQATLSRRSGVVLSFEAGLPGGEVITVQYSTTAVELNMALGILGVIVEEEE